MPLHNGGGLLLRENGEFIDSHAAVFRFNGGIVKGFEQFVGGVVQSRSFIRSVVQSRSFIRPLVQSRSFIRST